MSTLAVKNLDAFIYGVCPHPVTCGNGLEIGSGEVVPELNFTLPPMDIDEHTWPKVVSQYRDMITACVKRAEELECPSLLVEFETLPPMTIHPEYGLEITRILADELKASSDRKGIKTALRLTPNDTREFERPPLMRRGSYWERMLEFFDGAAAAGADLISIESTGGKEVCDEALVEADLARVVFSLGVLGARDMDFLWREIVQRCEATGIKAAGDSACGFANTAMVLAEKQMIPRLFAAVVRVASVPRALAAFTAGAVGPSKDCAYEGPYIKAITGCPISMEGRSAACAHLSPVGNISQAVCDCWSNESVQNVQLLSGRAPVVSTEQLAYDCRLLNTAAATPGGAAQLRDWLVASDSALDPQAWVLRPDVVLRISELIAAESDPYRQTVAGVRAALDEIQQAVESEDLRLPDREQVWIEMLTDQAEDLPDTEAEMIEQQKADVDPAKCLLEEYGIE